jgi:hypothetical protein
MYCAQEEGTSDINLELVPTPNETGKPILRQTDWFNTVKTVPRVSEDHVF